MSGLTDISRQEVRGCELLRRLKHTCGAEYQDTVTNAWSATHARRGTFKDPNLKHRAEDRPSTRWSIGRYTSPALPPQSRVHQFILPMTSRKINWPFFNFSSLSTKNSRRRRAGADSAATFKTAASFHSLTCRGEKILSSPRIK